MFTVLSHIPFEHYQILLRPSSFHPHLTAALQNFQLTLATSSRGSSSLLLWHSASDHQPRKPNRMMSPCGSRCTTISAAHLPGAVSRASLAAHHSGEGLTEHLSPRCSHRGADLLWGTAKLMAWVSSAPAGPAAEDTRQARPEHNNLLVTGLRTSGDYSVFRTTEEVCD